MKTCPYCAEEVKDNAIKCKHCHSDLINSHRDKIVRNTNIVVRRLFVIYFSLIFSIFSLVSFFGIVFAIIEPNLTHASNQKKLEEANTRFEESRRLREEAEKQTEKTLPSVSPSSDDFIPQENQETLYTIPEDQSYEDSNTGSLYTPLTQEPEYYGTNIDEYNQYTDQQNSNTEHEINQLINQGESIPGGGF
jgi:hypothetical protein